MSIKNNSINMPPTLYGYVDIPSTAMALDPIIPGSTGSVSLITMSDYLKSLVNKTKALDPNATLVFDVDISFSCTGSLKTIGVINYYISTNASIGNPRRFDVDIMFPIGSMTHFTGSTKIPVLISDIAHVNNTSFNINIINNISSAHGGGNLNLAGCSCFVHIDYLPRGYIQ